MTTTISARPVLYRRNPPPHGANRSSPAADAVLEFGRFRILLRRRRLVADGVPVELGTRAFDLLRALLEADASLVTKEELMHEPWVARHRRRGGEPEGSDLPVAQSSRRRPQFYPDRVRPRLPLHCRGSFDLRLGCLSGPEATKAPAQSKDCSPNALLGGLRARFVHPEVTLAGALILLPPRAPRLASFWISSAREKGEEP
jgi:hypothetical protein